MKDLKENIDKEFVEDPLLKLSPKNKTGTNFSLKTVSQKQLLKFIKKMKKKHSAGVDGLSQDKLVLGARSLVCPLLQIVNQSIREGNFPSQWKEALVTPVLKKGDPSAKENYRPVSSLPAASKLLEMVVNQQTSDFLESNNLLPHNQHGFRPLRSTMTAWSDIQSQWAQNCDENKITGVLLWDLSAAFDCLDPEILCKKLAFYGFDAKTISWFNSFLTGRTQRVKIGDKISGQQQLESGVPQGAILSPLIFVVYVSDLSDWLKCSVAGTYADDTQSSVSDKLLCNVKKNLESDALQVLKFMASNGLIANPKKTALLYLNAKVTHSVELSIKIGKETISPVKNAMLLGMTFENNLRWTEHIYGTGGLLASLNQRLFYIRRLRNVNGPKALLKLSNGLFISKLRYGLQMLGKVRWRDSDPSNQDLEAVQKCYNKLLRILNNSNLSEKISTKSMLTKFNLLSVNQINAQIKLTEMWKSVSIANYPIKTLTLQRSDDVMTTRAASIGTLQEARITTKSERTFLNDAIHIWNLAPLSIKNCTTIYSVKKAVKAFVLTLPV